MDDFQREIAEAIQEGLRANPEDCMCAGTQYLGKEWVLQREPACDCGEEDPDFETTFHAVNCDAVPCPFCVLSGIVEF